jgi:hypothetical protein
MKKRLPHGFVPRAREAMAPDLLDECEKHNAAKPSMTLSLPMPDACLSPNSRAHWTARNGARAAARTSGWAAATAALARRTTWPHVPLTVYVTIRGPRQSDADNALGRLKAVFDGIADALCTNDRNFEYAPVRYEKRGKGGNRHRLADPTDVEIVLMPTEPHKSFRTTSHIGDGG